MNDYVLVAAALLVVAKIGHRLLTRGGHGDTAESRSLALASSVLAEYRRLESSEPGLEVDEHRIRALLASGRSEADVRALVARAPSALHKSLQMLTVSLAAQAERARPTDAAGLMKNIVEAQKTVMGTTPKDL
jgi:hypothetical protein